MLLNICCNEDERVKLKGKCELSDNFLLTCILCQYAGMFLACLCLTDPSNFPQLYDNQHFLQKKIDVVSLRTENSKKLQFVYVLFHL